MIIKYVVTSESPLLKFSGERALNLLKFLSFSRYVFILTGLVGFVSPSIGDVFFCAVGILFHFIVHPYCGFFSNPKRIQNEQDFIPLRKWMVKGSDRELLGFEYEEVLNSFSSLTQRKMQEITKTQKSLFVYDVVNLLLLDMQYGHQSEWLSKDEKLKKDIKGDF